MGRASGLGALIRGKDIRCVSCLGSWIAYGEENERKEEKFVRVVRLGTLCFVCAWKA